MWALGTMLQRGFDHQDGFWVLIPYLDFVNNGLVWDEKFGHYKNINGFGDLERAEGQEPPTIANSRVWLEKALHNYKPGEEVLGTYSMIKGTLSYLLQYGYVTRGNMNDRIKLTLPGRADCLVVRDYIVPDWFIRNVAAVLREREEGGVVAREREDKGLTDEEIKRAKEAIKHSIRVAPIMQASSLKDDLSILHRINPAEYPLPLGEELRKEPQGPPPTLSPGKYAALAFRTEAKLFLENILHHIDSNDQLNSSWQMYDMSDYYALENIIIV